MRLTSFRFSVRTLLIAFAVFSVLLAISIQFGPHVVWRTWHSRVSVGVVPIPSRPLVAAAPKDVLVTCRVGPISFELPESLSRSIQVKGGYLHFQDNGRSIVLFLPKRGGQFQQQEIANFPDKAKLTFPRLYKELADSQSSDFSFGMSRRELAWHQWLLTTRAKVTITVDLIEYLWRPDLEGNLVTMSSMRLFEWSTIDGKWEGNIYFKGMSDGDEEWMRHLCTTFAIHGNPEIFKGRDAAGIEALIKINKPAAATVDED